MLKILRLSGPIAVSQIGMFLMVIVDTLMVSRLGAGATGALGLGSTFFFTVFPFGAGILLAIDGLAGRNLGEGRPEKALSWLSQGLYLSLLLALGSAAIVQAAMLALPALDTAPAVVEQTRGYMGAMLHSFLPYYLFFTLRQFLAALHSVRFTALVIFLAVGLNALLNAALIYGYAGFPELGVAGAGWATVLTRYLMLLAFLPFALKRIKVFFSLERFTFAPPRPAAVAEIFRAGLPIGAKSLIRSGFFILLGLWVAEIGTAELAAHTIAQNIGSFLFMLPAAVTMAVATLIAPLRGGLGTEEIQRTFRSGLRLALVTAAAVSAPLFFFRESLLGLFAPSGEVFAAAMNIFPLVIAVHVLDALAAGPLGALRGSGCNRPALLASVFGLWLTGSACMGALFLFRPSLHSLWLGLVAGLGASALYALHAWRKSVKNGGFHVERRSDGPGLDCRRLFGRSSPRAGVP